MTFGIEKGPAFIHLMRRYVLDYTNCHNQAVTPEIMVPEYRLRMGEHLVVGRDDQYRAATAKQMAQFPGLVLTVHSIATSGDRLVMRFSEHGASNRHSNKLCAWGGIGLYSWDGSRLIANSVEQDYLARREQLNSGEAHAVAGPAAAPWDTAAKAPDPGAEALVRRWLESGALAATPGVLCDDEWIRGSSSPLIEQTGIEINDLFSCGPIVAFHATQHGRFIPGDGIEGQPGARAFLDLAGQVRVEDGKVVSGEIIRNRIDLMRRFQQRSAA